MANRKILKSTEQTERVDRQTGEMVVTETTKRFSIPTSVDNFYMVFIGAMQGIFAIENLTDVKVLAKMCERAEYNTGKVYMTSNIRKEIMDQLQITPQTMSNSCARLKKLGLITGERGTYDLNAKVFWKGDTNTRAALLKEKNKLVLTAQIER